MAYQRRTLCLLLVACISAVLRVSGAPESDRIVSLPGQPAVPFALYSGFVTVDKDHGRALFYFFVEAASNASSKPLVLWLNGGPGCSSLGGGVFTELGPFFPNPDGTPSLIANPHSWNEEANILFLESPAGVGFSYSNTSSDLFWDDSKVADMYPEKMMSLDTPADDSLRFLLFWLEKFPEYQGRDFYITGESYAGHYIPDLAFRVITFSKIPGNYNFNLKGVLIGNPLLSLPVDAAATHEYSFSHGVISEQTYISIKDFCEFENVDYGSPNRNLSIPCINALIKADKELARDYVNVYDVLVDICLPEAAQQERTFELIRSQQQGPFHNRQISLGTDVCILNEVSQYLNLAEVQQALHIPGPVNWTLCSRIISYNLTDIKRDIIPELVEIIKAEIPVLLYSGDQDNVVPLLGTRHLSIKLAKELNLAASEYGVWFVDKQVAGWTQSFGPTNILTFATVRGAAHMVPLTQPARALQLFASFLAHAPLPTTPPF